MLAVKISNKESTEQEQTDIPPSPSIIINQTKQSTSPSLKKTIEQQEVTTKNSKFTKPNIYLANTMTLECLVIL